jgi:gliding motility-associated-like protein
MRLILKYITRVLLLLLPVTGFSQQREANVWYFGRFLGLDFNSGTAVPLNDGQLNTTEGVATISDTNGSLLFYTDGIRVWNRLHQVMPNGTGLFGDPSSTQSAIIVPKIGDPTRYFIFTVDQLSGPRGLNYSVVNMTLGGGNGDVEIKNSPLQSNVVEKITAVRHCNNRDIWVLAHGSVSDIYYAYLVSPTGINTTPVISHTGSVLPGVVAPSTLDSSALGYMKASPNGKKIAAAHWTVNADISDFDNATGVVSNSYSLFQPGDPHYLIYGIEFSPDSRLVYTTVFYTDPVNAQKRNALFQYDATLGTPAAVRASKQLISQSSDPIQVYAALQIAPDGKMYMAKNVYAHIASISNPNTYGSGCNFTSNAIAYSFPNQQSSFGLPTFVQSYFYPPDSFTYVVNCPGLSVNFNYTQQAGTSSVKWDFGDPASGANNTSSAVSPVHVFSAPGVYNVELVKFTSCGPDTLRKQVSTSNININLGPDTLVCGTGIIVLNSSATGSTNTFLWQDGSTNPTYTATTNGLYWVEARNSMGCISRDSINVSFKPMPVFNLGRDTSFCENDTLTLNATVTAATSYLWNNGAGTPTIKAWQAGTYWCAVNKDGCIFRDSLTINSLITRPVVNLGADQAICGNGPVILDATNPNCTYHWQDGTASPTYSVTASGLYWVEVINSGGCTKRDSVNIAFNSRPVFNLGADAALCQGDTLTLNATVSGAVSYLWNNGASTPTIKAWQAGLYWCEVNNGCVFRDSLTITAVNPKPIVNLGNDMAICGNGPVLLDATNPGCTYRWQDGSSNAGFSATTTGLYWVEVKNSSGCIKRDSINITFNSKPVFSLGTDGPICQGDTISLNATVTGATSYLWNNGATTSTIRAWQAGLYWCEVSNGCVFRDSLTITAVKPEPVVNLGPDVTVCEGIPVLLDASFPGATFNWQDGSSNPDFNVLIPGLYYVLVDLNGCRRSDSVLVSHNLKPRFTLGNDQYICAGNPVILKPVLNPAWQLSWQDGSGSPSYTITQPGTYSLTATNNCGSTLDEIKVDKGVCSVYVPTGFTPNNDGLNDFFKVMGTENVARFVLKIYNRWGELVFQTNDKNSSWDGKWKGATQPASVFIYTLQYTDVNDPVTRFLKGTFTLIR